MINILSYFGMTVQSEVCLWTLLGILSTIFDATLFKVNANLKQVWQMTMPAELSLPVQRALRTMISSIMLVQCFTVYVYLATYIVLLYPVFLEERPTLVLPWLLLAAVRKLLCELLSLALGLATCLLVGPARPPCIKFVVTKMISIMPAFYMWMLVLSYYHALKVASSFKTFRAAMPPKDLDYGLELAIRRRRTKSLFGEALVRSRLISNLYSDKQLNIARNMATSKENDSLAPNNLGPDAKTGDKVGIENKLSKIDEAQTTFEQVETDKNVTEVMQTSIVLNRLPSDIGTYEDWFGNEIMVPRNTDRINEQFGLMMLRISAYLRRDSNGFDQIFESSSILAVSQPQYKNLNCQTLSDEATDTPPLVASNKSNLASYLRDYPDIFMRRNDSELQQKLDTIRAVQSQIEGKATERASKELRQVVRINSGANILDRALSQETNSGVKQINPRPEKKFKTGDSKHGKDDKYKAERNMKLEKLSSEAQNNTEALENDVSASPISSTDSLTSAINRMKRSLLRAKSSKKLKAQNATSTRSQIGSSSTSSKES